MPGGQDLRAGLGRRMAVMRAGTGEAGRMLCAEEAPGAGPESARGCTDTVWRAPRGQAPERRPRPLQLSPFRPTWPPLAAPTSLSLPPAEPAPTVCLWV